jgi:hypothetical protein
MLNDMGLQFVAGDITLKTGIPGNYYKIAVGCCPDCLGAFCLNPPDCEVIPLYSRCVCCLQALLLRTNHSALMVPHGGTELKRGATTASRDERTERF